MNGQDVLPSPEFVEVLTGQSCSKPLHDRPLVCNVRTGDRAGDALHARNVGHVFQEDNVVVLEDLTLCALNGQEFL